jgi:Domain of unknown function (DUF4404)
MPAQQPSAAPDPKDVQANLQELARLLHDADHLDPEAQRELADLVAELSRALSGNLPSAEVEHLGQSAVHMIQALHQQQDTDFLTAARDRLRDAAVRAEVQAPVATGIVRRIIDTLANLGI